MPRLCTPQELILRIADVDENARELCELVLWICMFACKDPYIFLGAMASWMNYPLNKLQRNIRVLFTVISLNYFK